MAIFAKFKLSGSDVPGEAARVDVTAGAGLSVPDLNGSTIINSLNLGTALAGTGAGSQNYELSCIKEIDAGTCKDLEAADTNGTVEVVFYCTRQAQDAESAKEECYMTVDVKGARFTSINISETGVGGAGTETLGIKYDTMEVTYKGGISYTIEWAKR